MEPDAGVSDCGNSKPDNLDNLDLHMVAVGWESFLVVLLCSEQEKIPNRNSTPLSSSAELEPSCPPCTPAAAIQGSNKLMGVAEPEATDCWSGQGRVCQTRSKITPSSPTWAIKGGYITIACLYMNRRLREGPQEIYGGLCPHLNP